MWLNKNVILPGAVVCALFSTNMTFAQGAADAAATIESTKETADAPVLTDEQQTAQDLLMNMAAQLGGAERFQVDIRAGYDALQASGQKIEYGEQRRVYLERPSLLLVDTENSDGSGEAILFDGKWITVSNMGAKVYARAPQPGDIDATVQYFENVLHMRLPLGAMLMSQFPDVLEHHLVDINYVEETEMLGEPADHIAGRTRDVDFQVWISKGKQNVPLRIVLTYREAPAQPQFWADFTKWNFHPSFAQRIFRFEPIAGAREVPLAAAFTRHSPAGAAAATPSAAGEKP